MDLDQFQNFFEQLKIETLDIQKILFSKYILLRLVDN